MIAMATATRSRKGKAKAKAANRAARRTRKSSTGAAAGRRKTPETTVVHVDREVYGLLRKERRPEDRGMNAPLRRMLGIETETAVAS